MNIPNEILPDDEREGFSKHPAPETIDIEENPDEIHEVDFVLSHQDAKAASPASMAVCGEEDPGEGLEFLVTKTHDQ